ncbi:MAG: hypothetical protein WAS34_18865 [Thiolinea sp.]
MKISEKTQHLRTFFLDENEKERIEYDSDSQMFFLYNFTGTMVDSFNEANARIVLSACKRTTEDNLYVYLPQNMKALIPNVRFTEEVLKRFLGEKDISEVDYDVRA